VETENNLQIEHQNVPVEHQGLHSFLYSSESEHAVTAVTASPDTVSDGSQVLPLEIWCDRSQNTKTAGVYAVLAANRETQYIGYSRNVLLSLKGHLTQNGAETCALVRVQPFTFPKREAMEELRDAWLSELDYIPPGNGEMSGMWAATVGEVAKAAMSAAERQAYEEKKLKLRKAIADTTLKTETEKLNISDDEQRRRLEEAVKNDDWSGVIDTQTQETRS